VAGGRTGAQLAATSRLPSHPIHSIIMGRSRKETGGAASTSESLISALINLACVVTRGRRRRMMGQAKERS
jgi:hypothetical protein